VFPNKKHEFLLGCTKDRRTGLQAAQKGGPAGCRNGADRQAAEKGSLLAHTSLQPRLMGSQLAHLS